MKNRWTLKGGTFMYFVSEVTLLQELTFARPVVVVVVRQYHLSATFLGGREIEFNSSQPYK